jgi:radical SAM protein with 4Fe4S-binding SPASM domain
MRKLLGYARIFYNWQIQKNTILDYVPEDISIELTNTCNFKCSFCPQSDPSHFDRVARSSLSPEQVDTLLSKLRKGGVKTNVIHWTLDGEPFINQSIDEICAVAIRNGFYKFIFSTNGYFCTPERVLKLPKNHPDVSYTFWVDYCADSELFERHRGTPNSWERVRTNILKILEHPQLQHININLTDISSFKISDPNVLSQNLVALKQLFPESDRFNVTSRIFHNATGFVPGILERKKDKNTKYNLCPYPWTSFVIASNGDVVACCRDLEHKTVLGNLFTEELKEIWNGDRYQVLRQSLVEQNPQKMQACAGCDLPYDQGKFSFQHILRTGISRLGIFQ